MIPDGGEASTNSSGDKDDGVLAGYRECATEALNWLLNLGYAPGHPLVRSLAAHLTKKQAYLEKINLEKFLIDETFRNSMGEFQEVGGVDEEVMDSRYRFCTYQIQNDREIQKALVDAVFKGCDLHYCEGIRHGPPRSLKVFQFGLVGLSYALRPLPAHSLPEKQMALRILKMLSSSSRFSRTEYSAKQQ